MKKLLSIAALGSLLAALVLAAAPAWAQNVDSRIQTLENELTRLKSEQMELKKDAVAAAAALPTFSYRPGGGLSITAADQSWAIKFGYEFQYDMMWLAGNDARREGDFGLFGRRNRPAVYYYWDNGFYEFKSELDLDSDETGGKDSLNQRSAILFHFEKMNPFFPTVQTGMDVSGAGTFYRSSELTRELPTLDRNNGFNTGAHTGISALWQGLPAFGLPGTQDFLYYWVIHGMGRSDGLKDQSNAMDHMVVYNINPFSQDKNKWINGIGFSMQAWFGNIDDRNTTNTTRQIGIRTQEGSTRVTLWTSATQGRGLHTFLSPSIQYKVGPYQLRGSTGFDRYNTEDNTLAPNATIGKVKGTYWKLMNDIMLWSPKGLFTGSATTPSTLGLGWSFERTDLDCGRPGCGVGSGATFRRDTILVRELDLRYWIRPSASLWWTWKFYDASNTPTASQVAIGCSKNNATLLQGKSCDWNDFVLGLTWTY